MSDHEEIVREFIAESGENLDRFEQDLVLLEKDPSSQELLTRIFRAIHTIKGTSGFLGFPKLESVTHAGENILSLLRDGKLRIRQDVASALLSMTDVVRRILACVEQDGTEGDNDVSLITQRLDNLLVAGQETIPQSAAPAAALLSAPVDEVAPSETPEDHAHGPQSSDNSIRVDVGLLDSLMNLVGELVLTRNQILQLRSTRSDSVTLETCQRLNLITSELQEHVIKTRMQPVGRVWGKFPRLVRDLAVACGKSARIDMEGMDTELDKSIIESIKDPLTHMVRNAVDHGIESPAQRAMAGKPVEGSLVLRAYHEAGQVNIEMSDDGAGLDLERIKRQALHGGVVESERLDRMSDQEVINLIFLPGFSTAAQVTSVSGRGVGMDVVKTNIDKIGGTIDIMNRPGRGTTFRIRIPLTLAIIPALMVGCGGSRYAIPQISLVELVRLEGEKARAGIEAVHGAPVYRLRGRLLPLVYLREELGQALSPTSGGSVQIIVLQANEHQFGLVVDQVYDTEEIVVKPLSKTLRDIACYAGATILGDGRVALILDVPSIADKAHVVSVTHEHAFHEEPVQPRTGDGEIQTLLLLRSPDNGRMAVPLSKVSRLEKFYSSIVERAASQDMVQYRGRILPLLHLASVIQERRVRPRNAEGGIIPSGETVQVVVHQSGERTVGLVVDRILDIVEDRVLLQQPGSRPGILGTAVVQGRVTEIVDVDTVVRLADQDLAARQGA